MIFLVALFCNPLRPLGIRQNMPSAREAVELLCAALEKRISESVLFRHEVCYLLGQIGGDLSQSEEDVDLKRDILRALSKVAWEPRENNVILGSYTSQTNGA